MVLVERDVKPRLTFAEPQNVSMETVLTNFSDMNVFVNLDGVETCVMSTLMTVIPTHVLMVANVLMMSMISAVFANKDSLERDVNTLLIIVNLILVKMVELAKTLRHNLFVNADLDMLASHVKLPLMNVPLTSATPQEQLNAWILTTSLNVNAEKALLENFARPMSM